MSVQQHTCCQDFIGAPNPELSLSVLYKDHRLQHILQAEAWLSESYKKMSHLGKSVQSSLILTTISISS